MVFPTLKPFSHLTQYINQRVLLATAGYRYGDYYFGVSSGGSIVKNDELRSKRQTKIGFMIFYDAQAYPDWSKEGNAVILIDDKKEMN